MGTFHTHFKIRVVLIIEEPTISVNYRKALKVMLHYFN
jgi:hypothetical protein